MKESEEVTEPVDFTPMNRRKMLKQTLLAGLLLPQASLLLAQGYGGYGGRGGQGGRGHARRTVDPSQIPAYRYKTLPVSRFGELQAEYSKALSGAQYSRSKVFRDDVGQLGFKVPASFSGAKSVIVVAAYTKPMFVNFTINGGKLRVLVPPQYYVDDHNAAAMKGIVQREILKNPSSRVEEISKSVPLKLLAAHSGLGQYGRNNLIFVDGMGSYSLLYAFLTDRAMEDNWTQVSVMGHCNHCDHCDRSCPTSSIGGNSFPINIDKCVTLYNEKAGAFPSWMLRSTHNALMGCIRCQEGCPENNGYSELSGVLEEVTEEETRKILKGVADEALLKSLQRKLRQFPGTMSKEQFPILSRNLSVLTRS